MKPKSTQNSIKNLYRNLCRVFVRNPTQNSIGNFYRNFIHVSDACRAIKLICDDGEYDEIYNIGSVNNSLFKDIIKIAAEELNSISTIDSMAPPNFHKIVQVKNMKLDTKKLHALGFKEMMTLKMGISELCKNS